MGKKKEIDKLTTVLAGALRHKIGSLVGRDEIYAKKYMGEFSARLEIAKKIIGNLNLNSSDKIEIKEGVRHKLKKELEDRPYINEVKFEVMDEEINNLFEQLENF